MSEALVDEPDDVLMREMLAHPTCGRYVAESLLALRWVYGLTRPLVDKAMREEGTTEAYRLAGLQRMLELAVCDRLAKWFPEADEVWIIGGVSSYVMTENPPYRERWDRLVEAAAQRPA